MTSTTTGLDERLRAAVDELLVLLDGPAPVMPEPITGLTREQRLTQAIVAAAGRLELVAEALRSRGAGRVAA